MKEMTTLTLDGETFEIADKQVREDTNNHINNNGIHVTLEEKSTWNDKYTRDEIDAKFNNMDSKNNVIKAPEGMILTNGKVYGSFIPLGNWDNADNYYAITKEEYSRIIQKQLDAYNDILL